MKSLDQRDNIFCIVDMHAITVFQDPRELATVTRQAAGLLLACGLAPDKCLLYVQSHVPAHSELGWMLTCVTPVGWLTRMTQYRAKSAGEDSVGTGLLCYPVLQAADVLLFQTDVVPTGDDQRAHIELARDIAARFNRLYGDTFKLPRSEVPEVGARIMGLDDPSAKMSKSVLKTNPWHGIGLLDEPDRVVKVIKKAVTDTGGAIAFDDAPEKAGINNLLTIYQACTDRSPEEVLADFAGARGYGDVKKRVAEVVVETLRPIRAAYDELMKDVSYVESVLERAGERASERCEPTLKAAKHQMGLRHIPGA